MSELDITISDLNDISEILDNNGYGGWCKTLDKAVELLKEKQTKKAEWIEWYPGDCSLIMTGEEMLYACSMCDAKFIEKSNFCPHCGADMRKDGERNEKS